MARGRVDTGVRNSIRTVVGYAGLALAGLIAISSAGIDLSSFALVAGGLSLGIGFGLQNVVSNFVSGLILLAERPFKAGDWIVAGDVSGTVKKISVRATEIETFQRQSVILPNSQLINSAVGNWTHRNKLGRVDIKVGVAYGMDVKRAHAVLLDIAKSHPLVLKNPEPFVLFSNFGPAALEFEIRVFLADVLNGNVVQNDIRFAVLDAFDAEGIEIPSTPRAEVKKPEERWPTDDEKDEAALVEEKAREEAALAEQKAARRRPAARGSPIPTRLAAGAFPNCGMNVAFSCRSDWFSYKVAAKGRKPCNRGGGKPPEPRCLRPLSPRLPCLPRRFGAGGKRGQSRPGAAHADRHRRRQQVRARDRRAARPSISARAAASSPCPTAISKR